MSNSIQLSREEQPDPDDHKNLNPGTPKKSRHNVEPYILDSSSPPTRENKGADLVTPQEAHEPSSPLEKIRLPESQAFRKAVSYAEAGSPTKMKAKLKDAPGGIDYTYKGPLLVHRRKNEPYLILGLQGERKDAESEYLTRLEYRENFHFNGFNMIVYLGRDNVHPVRNRSVLRDELLEYARQCLPNLEKGKAKKGEAKKRVTKKRGPKKRGPKKRGIKKAETKEEEPKEEETKEAETKKEETKEAESKLDDHHIRRLTTAIDVAFEGYVNRDDKKYKLPKGPGVDIARTLAKQQCGQYPPKHYEASINGADWAWTQFEPGKIIGQ
ncbi:MAG: hypothetical protein Q9160_007166 [Pyrenula sp. 1 TL-2023]